MSKTYDALTNYTNGFKEGYDMGFKAGYDAAKREMPLTTVDPVPFDKWDHNVCSISD